MGDLRILTEKDYKVLKMVCDKDRKYGFSKINGITVSELAKKTDLSTTKVRDALNCLIGYGFINLGISKGRSKTYYITNEGLTELSNIVKMVIKD